MGHHLRKYFKKVKKGLYLFLCGAILKLEILFSRLVKGRASQSKISRVIFDYFFGIILCSESEGIMNNDNETIELPWENKTEDHSSVEVPSPLTQDELEELMHEIRF